MRNKKFVVSYSLINILKISRKVRTEIRKNQIFANDSAVSIDKFNMNIKNN